VRSGAESINFEYAEGVAKLSFGILVVIIAGLAIGQLKIETALLNRVIEIVIIAVAVTIALALGFGARELAHNLLAGFYARETYKPGSNIRVGESEGTLEAVGSVNSRIKTTGGAVYVPNSQLVGTVVRVK
jgi:small-conductance mechanosensitive channel